MNVGYGKGTLIKPLTFRDLGFAVLLIGLTLVFVELKLAQKASYSSSFLIGEESQNFIVADRLLSGGLLYRDTASPYGYIPAYSYALLARVFRNRIATYYSYFKFLDSIIVLLLYGLSRRVLSPLAAFLWTLFAFIPQVIAPGSPSGGLVISPSFPLEKILLLSAALLWKGPLHQGWTNSVLIGICLGLLQGVKFGGGVVAGLAIALIEFLFLFKRGFSKAAWMTFFKTGAAILLGFSIVEVVWIILAYLTLPFFIAHDVIWPSYMLKNYAGFASTVRWPRWIGVRYFLGVQAVPLLGLAGACWLARDQFRSRSVSSARASDFSMNGTAYLGGVLFLPLFYVLGCLVYFKQFWHFNLYSWTLVIGACFLLIQRVRVIGLVTVIICILSFAAFVRASLLKPDDPSLVRLALANGEQLWVTGPEYLRFRGVLNTVNDSSNAQTALPVVFYPIGAGFHTFFNIPQEGRSYYFAPGLIRPYDSRELISLAEHAAYWVVFLTSPSNSLSNDPAEWNDKGGFAVQALDETTRTEIMKHMSNPRKIDSQCWIFSTVDSK